MLCEQSRADTLAGSAAEVVLGIAWSICHLSRLDLPKYRLLDVVPRVLWKNWHPSASMSPQRDRG